MTTQADSLDARNEIDQAILSLEDLCRERDETPPEEQRTADDWFRDVSEAMKKFRFGRDGLARFATLEHVGRL
jgi:hypothetical protein